MLIVSATSLGTSSPSLVSIRFAAERGWGTQTTYRRSRRARDWNHLSVQFAWRLLSLRIARVVPVPPVEPLRRKGHRDRPGQPHEDEG